MTMDLNTPAGWIIRTDEPFRGTSQSAILADGTVAWSGGLTVEQYQAERGFPVRVVTDAELMAMVAEFEAGLITDPEPITGEKWAYWLECLPPCRWTMAQGWEVFHISERLRGDLVTWCARKAGRYYAFTDRAGASLASLVLKLVTADGQALDAAPLGL